MLMHSNTIFITGGGAGIGRGLAEAFHKLGNRVIIGGRREDVLHAACDANPGMKYFRLDVTDPADIQQVAAAVVRTHPDLNCVINNAGIQRVHDFSVDEPMDDDDDAVDEINTNFLGLVRVCAAFVPHLRQKPGATLINVSSGLALLPLARFPVYCATKAAVHSFTMSLRYQLRDSPVNVVELIPPYVATELDKRTGGLPNGPTPMPLADFIAAAMEELATGADEAAVGTVKSLLSVVKNDAVRAIFARMNPG